MKLRIIAFTALLSLAAWAKPKPTTKDYAAPCSKVWEAAKTAVKNGYEALSLNDQSQSGSFTTGNAWTGVRTLTFSLSGSGDSCTVSMTGHFSGLVHNDKGDFFKRIQDELSAPEQQAKSK